MIEKIKKRDGRIVPFEEEKITNAIFKAAKSVGGEDKERAEYLSDQVVAILEKKYAGEIPNVEKVQDIVEKVLIENGHAKTAKSYILYREKRSKMRKTKALLGIKDDLKLPLNSLIVLSKRYLKKDEDLNIIETPRQMFRRVAKSIASVEKYYGKSEEYISNLEEEFFDMMKNLEFLPNSPTLMNAGTGTNLCLSACFVIPVDDDMESIYDAIKAMAMVQKAGGGTGFSFSKLRPKGDVVRSTGGIASGPLSFMRAFNVNTDVIKQGGKRRGANMGVLRVDHPDILDFVVTKQEEGRLNNFNISVGLTNEFMRAVAEDNDFNLVNPRTGEPVKGLKARAVWNLIITMAWRNGEPGIIFLDNINKNNPTPKVGKITATNPCGEQPLLPYESCNLGSINLSKMVIGDEINWEKLKNTVRKAVRFLDNVIDANSYPVKEIEEKTKKNRKIGLGVMGFADMLIQLEIPYNSEKSIKTAERIMKFITEEGRKMSVELGEEKASFPNFDKSIWKNEYETMRNATVTTIAPTGTIGVIANCSSGIEPLFAISYVRNVKDSLGENLVEINPIFESYAIRHGFYTEDLIKNISKKSSIQHIKEIPKEIRDVFITAHDISPEWHIRIQAAFQKYTDNAVSKTVNFPFYATPHDIEKVYWLAYKLGCKGVTVYRDGSRKTQIITTDETTNKTVPEMMVSPEYSGGCSTCHI